MQDRRMLQADEESVPKPRKKKPSTQKVSKFQTQGDSRVQVTMQPLPTQTGQKATKRGLTNNVSSFSQQPEKSTSDSLLDSSTSGNEYRALRRKYLLLEEESFGLGRELTGVEEDVKALEDKKLALLEGMVDPSELQSQGLR